ncbi:helix-turn-helix domain-containing protein [Latilactobacillus curvatus]|uniref:helix-turn-helix domain-containing protein n=1 Tax=Latilactobacillus curvatus TaxID=28038 RepID=UPI00097817A5|nr:helix-turn-helix domain-containing protein [Latilactobacillus curvatus]
MAKGKYLEWVSEQGLLMIEGWARDGLTDAQISKNMGISRSTLNEWKKKYPDISDTLKRSKEVVDREVENSLLKRALGMVTKTTTYKMVKVDDDVLKVKRERYLNSYKLEHPDLSKKELLMAAIEAVPTYEQIPITENEVELAPDTSAAIFWLKNRKPDAYRDQSFKELNEAQAEKARADVRKATAEAEIKEAEAKAINGDDEMEDDGFIAAIDHSMSEVWTDETED